MFSTAGDYTFIQRTAAGGHTNRGTKIMSKLVNRIAAVAALALAATPIVGLAAAHAGERAAPAAAVPIARVQIGDLILSHPEGAREFQRRADRAAERACTARGVHGLSYRACLMDIAQDFNTAMTPTQRSALMTGRSAIEVASR